MFNLAEDENFCKQKAAFDVYYENVLLPKLCENDKIRTRYFRMFIVLLLLAIIFYPLVIWMIIVLPNDSAANVDIGAALCVSGFVILALRGPIYFYKKKAKNAIMADFAGFFGSFRYENERRLPDELLKQSELFGHYNFSKGDDFFFGSYKDVDIVIAEELLQKISVVSETNTASGVYAERRKNIKKNVFRGICILLTMNKNFKGRTVVLKDKGIFNVLKQVSGLQRVKLEDMYFEDLFEVYSSDQIEARYLLTAAFMERMLKLTELYGGKSIQFSFNNNQLLLAISTKQDMFEACSFFRSNVNKDKIYRVFEQFYTVFSVVDVLKLNKKTGL